MAAGPLGQHNMFSRPSGPAKNFLQPKAAHDLLWPEAQHHLTAHTHTHIHTYRHTHTNPQTPTSTHTNIHTHTHINIHIHTNTHTHKLNRISTVCVFKTVVAYGHNKLWQPLAASSFSETSQVLWPHAITNCTWWSLAANIIYV